MDVGIRFDINSIDEIDSVEARLQGVLSGIASDVFTEDWGDHVLGFCTTELTADQVSEKLEGYDWFEG